VLSHSDAHPHAPQCLAVDRARDALTTLCPTMLTLRATLGERVGCRDGVAPVFGGIRSDRNVPGRSRRRVGRGREPDRDYL